LLHPERDVIDMNSRVEGLRYSDGIGQSRAYSRGDVGERNKIMPEIIVYAVEGRTAEQKKSLMKDITDSVVRNFQVPAEAVTVQIVESKKDSKAKGGVPFTER
jgi:4-oxalocrotonate tautomerase